MSKTGQELRDIITDLELSQVDFARWLQVSPGAVAQWLSEARSIPGPVRAFLKLFENLPPMLQERELLQIKKGNAEMEGMYAVEFAGSAGYGGASITFKDGLVYGFDVAGGVYDGIYMTSGNNPGTTLVEVAVKIPAGVKSVVRGMVHPFDWTIIASAEIPTNAAAATIAVTTNLKETLTASFKRMRGLPASA